MKLLLDENLSFRVLPGIMDLYPGSVHVADLGLQQSSDAAVWDRARRDGFVIATKDDDFQRLSLLKGHPPKVISLDVGNCPTGHIIHLLRSHRDDLVRFGDDPDSSLLVIGR